MKIIKKLPIFLLIAALPILLAACGQNDISPYSPSQMAEAIIYQQTVMPVMHPLLSNDSRFAGYLLDVYRIEADMLDDGAVYYANGVEASEIAVFLLSDGADAEQIKDALLEYIERRAGLFTGYAPLQAAMMRNGIVAVRGNYVALLVCQDPQKAEAVFAACFSDDPPELPETQEPSVSSDTDDDQEPGVLGAESAEPPPSVADDPQDTDGVPEEPPETVGQLEDDPEDIYDSAAILAVWNSGDSSPLTYKNRRILDACAEVIGAGVEDDMTDYEKELVIHDWIVGWADYDDEALSNAPDARPCPDNDNPYGLLFHRKAVCRGYTSTFQLFMDMLGIECITVEGTAIQGNEPHAWNMVRLDGEWYCVDVTWDDPMGSVGPVIFISHMFFNVTSQFLRENDHQWDESAAPEAAATAYAYHGNR